MSSGPVLSLVGQGVGLWLRRICDRLDALDLDLQGSGLALLGGRLEGAQLRASGVVFQHLALAEVALASGPVELNVGAMLKGQPLQLRERFRVKGQVLFTAEGLNQSLANGPWRQFSDGLAQQLLGCQRLGAYGLENNQLVLIGAHGGRQACDLRAEAGQLWLQGLAVPLDSAIQIERVSINGDRLRLEGSSLVSAAGGAAG
ncbi:MAG: DUF2993 domain-containing protein [Synechococcaceae bacterium WB6_3B_236]|jgi:hypothetical protein|nr:DUF2993 domain-containing protein [Synechococcaceae bacterium WB6_3B_236]